VKGSNDDMDPGRFYDGVAADLHAELKAAQEILGVLDGLADEIAAASARLQLHARRAVKLFGKPRTAPGARE
jgi:hypothetical protein